MPKPKKGRKNKQDDDFDDDGIDIDPLAVGPKDIADDLAELNIKDDDASERMGSKKDKKKKKQSKKDVSDDEDDDLDILKSDAPPPSKQSGKKAKKSNFQMLNMMSQLDDSDDDDKSQSDDDNDDDDESPEPKEEETKPLQQKQPKKKAGKKEKPKKPEDEDIDAIMADLDKPSEKGSKKKKKGKKDDTPETDVVMPAEVTSHTDGIDISNMTQDELAALFDLDGEDEDDKPKKKKKKGKGKKAAEEPAEGGDDAKEDEDKEEGDEENDEGSTVKTAAQKKKEKKEREKEKKRLEKEKQQKKKDAAKTDDSKEKTPEMEKMESQPSAPTEKKEEPASKPTEEGAEPKEGDDMKEEGDSKKKKKDKKKDKKKGKDEKEDEDAKKKPKNKKLAALQEALQKAKEEEERILREEQAKIEAAERAKKEKEERERQEQEKREAKKLKKKQKMEEMKKAGKFLTEKQKADKRRAMQMLEQMKQQGIEVPSKEDAEAPKKRVVYDNRRKKKQKQKEDSPELETPTESPAVTPATEEPKFPTEEISDGSKSESPIPGEPANAIESKEEEDAKDAWDLSSDEEDKDDKEPKAEKKVPKVEVAVVEPKKVEETKEDEEEEDDDEEENDEGSDEEEDESDEEEESEESSSEEEVDAHEKALARIQKRHDDAEKKRSVDNLRAPVVCVLGHVDTGKTKILDKLRRTHVQDGEAGGITQQIGATNVPKYAILEATKMCKEFQKNELKLPGLLIIDTPGHESFSNLRSRGSSLCDIAILVVDIMHGLEPQTIESINLLKKRRTPFIVALNKIDRLFDWKTNPHSDIQNVIKKQAKNTKDEFDERTKEVVVQFAEQGLNTALSYENKNTKEYISMVPTSAISGDGMGNLMATICELTQTRLAKQVSYSEELQATVMEVKALPGLGTTLDVILVNGKLREGDKIVLAGTEGPIVTSIRGLLKPQPMKELRVKNAYSKFKEVIGAEGCKIIAKDMEKALAGLPLHVAYHPNEVDIYKEDVENQLKNVLNSIKTVDRGVYVQASTLGSLEALLEFLRTSKIPYSGISVGPVHKKDVMKASIMLEHETQYAVILAFDVKVERDAQELADSVGVKIFTADIIYHLFDRFMAYREEFKMKKKEQFKHIAVFPCKLRVLPQFIFNTRDPIVVGVSVEAGVLAIGTPVCVPSKEFVEIGRVFSIEINHKPVETARKGQEVCIKIEPVPGQAPKLYGRHFDHTDQVVSKITRESIDALKDYFRDDMQKSDWQLIIEFKKLFQIL